MSCSLNRAFALAFVCRADFRYKINHKNIVVFVVVVVVASTEIIIKTYERFMFLVMRCVFSIFYSSLSHQSRLKIIIIAISCKQYNLTNKNSNQNKSRRGISRKRKRKIISEISQNLIRFYFCGFYLSCLVLYRHFDHWLKPRLLYVYYKNIVFKDWNLRIRPCQHCSS